MKQVVKVATHLALLVSATILLTGCPPTNGGFQTLNFYYYFIEADDDATSGEIRYDNSYRFYEKDGYTAWQPYYKEPMVINSTTDSIPYGRMFISYNYKSPQTADYIPDTDPITIQRMSGNGTCTIYIVDKVDTRFQDGNEYNLKPTDEFPDWIRRNYKYKFLLTDDNEQTLLIRTDNIMQ